MTFFQQDSAKISALVAVGDFLRGGGYEFTCVTPETHRRVNAAAQPLARDLRGVFGWSRVFDASLLPEHALEHLQSAGALERVEEGMFKSAVRFATLGNEIFVHSAYPTNAAGSVFFGPDTYRFCNLIERELAGFTGLQDKCIVDIGCGSGPGGIVATKIATAKAVGSQSDQVRLGPNVGRKSARTVLADINTTALMMARVNAVLAGITDEVEFVESDVYAGVKSAPDIVVSNPPYMRDAQTRAYRDGGADYGSQLSLRILAQTIDALNSGGLLILYTGTAVVAGTDVFLRAAEPILQRSGCQWRYAQIDPDVFGDELDQPHYFGVERIAAVSLVVRKN